MIAFGKAFLFEHILKDLRYLRYLVVGVIDFLLDKLRLNALEGIGQKLGDNNRDVDCDEFVDEGERAEVKIDHKHSYKISLNTIIQLI